MLAGIATLGGCFERRTVDCGGGHLCPADQACAAPGHCGDPAQVEKCEAKQPWDTCAFTDITPGSCRFGVCEACTADREGCGTGWRAMSVPTTAELNAVWVVDRADAYAVGDGGVLLHYDGTRWSAVLTSPPIATDIDLESIWGSSGDDFYVTSTHANERNVLHITNRTTLAYEMVGSDGMKAVWGTGVDNVYVAGFLGMIRQFDGAGWKQVSSGGQTLAKLSGASETRAFAIGTSGAIARLEGTQWMTSTVSTPPVLTDVWASETEAFITGESRTLLRLSGSTWQPVAFDATVPVGLHLYAVWGAGDRFYAVGDAGKIIQSTNGADWIDASPNLGTNVLRAIGGTSTSNIFVVGSNGGIWRYTD